MDAKPSSKTRMEVDMALDLQQVLALSKEAVQLETKGLYSDSALKWRQAASLLSSYANANIDPNEQQVATKVKALIGWLVSRAIENSSVKQLAPNYISFKSFKQYIDQAMAEMTTKENDAGDDQTTFTVRRPTEINAPNFWDLHGLDDIRNLIASLFASNDTFNLMMFGPPGTGKTFMAASIAKSYNLLFIEVNSGNLMSSYVGGTEKNIKNLFDFARKNVQPKQSVLIFFDEAEAILSTRTDSPIATNPVTQFMIEMEKDSNAGVFFFFTTNLLSRIEPAIKRRCYGLFIGYPKTKEAIASLYKDNLARYQNTVSEDLIKKLAESNKLLSPSAIADIVKLSFTMTNKISLQDRFREIRNHVYVKDPNGPYTFAEVSRREGHPLTKSSLEIIAISDENLLKAWEATPALLSAEELERFKDEAKELLQI